ncbi:MAG TPA: hypothetical protein VN802_14990 [Stellaceae bacterium]|nr:hypothetical protein [Stellaceae bacterium]
MLTLARIFIVLAPQQWLAFATETSRFFISWAAGGVFAAAAGMLYVSRSWSLPWTTIRLAWPFLAFVLIGVLSLATSPYFAAALSKGAVQAVGIATMLTVAFGFSTLVSGNLSVLMTLIKWSAATAGVVGLIAVGQFAVNNIVRAPVVEFSFLGQLFGGFDEFGQRGTLGGLWRATSIATEPARMCSYLSVALGTALVRVGLAGRDGAAVLRPYVPGWAAFGILGGFAASLSLEGYMALILAAVAILIARRRTRTHRARLRGQRYINWGVGAAAVAVVAIPFAAGPDLIGKLGTLELVYQAFDPDAPQISAVGRGDISALAIAANAVVAVDNLEERPLLGMGLGAHPVTYDDLVPDFAYNNEAGLNGLNKDDAASLLLRLLSETGLLGTLAFAAGAFAVLRQGWMVARSCGGWHEDGRLMVLHFTAIGMIGSCTALFFRNFSRDGTYFDATLWECIGLTLSLVSFAPAVGVVIARRSAGRRASPSLP